MAPPDVEQQPPSGPKGTKRKEPTPPPPSPPRKRKRPAARAVPRSQIQHAQKREEERSQANQPTAQNSVSDFVTQHYNAVPERGREWRRTESNIKGLRSYNNWVKSVLIIKHAPKQSGFKILDIGCGKGGDLGKWQHQNPSLYVGLDPADVSIQQASDRYNGMKRKNRRLFHAEFGVKDCFGSSLIDIPIVREVGFDKDLDARWGGGGFDVVSMMFCMHYAFESEEKARIMLKNVAASLKKGGMFIGVIPNSDVLTAKVEEYHKKMAPAKPEDVSGRSPSADPDMPAIVDSDDDWDPEKPLEPAPETKVPEKEPEQTPDDAKPDGQDSSKRPTTSQDTAAEEVTTFEFGNSIFKVKFPGKTPLDGIFRPPFGWKYFYYLEEAVEAPEYVVPWEAFRALAEDYNLELEYRKPFREVWEEESENKEFGLLSERMGVKSRNGNLLVSEEEMEASSFYHAFCFYKV